MDFLQLVSKRQSVRSYTQEKIAKEKIERCLEAARLAPSACNSQPWHFVVVDELALLSEVAKAASDGGMNKFAKEAPVIVAVVLEKMNFIAKVGSLLKNKDYCMLDLGMAVEHFCLQAAEEGLGTCILGWFNEKKIAELLRVPKGKRIPLLIVMGHANDQTRNKIRKSMDHVSSWNIYKHQQK